MCVELGAMVVDHLSFRDHHDYRSKDIQKINNTAKLAAADVILTTEKDGVKLQRYGNDFEKPVYLMTVDNDIFFPGNESIKKAQNIFHQSKSLLNLA